MAFSDATISLFLPKLVDPTFVDSLVARLRAVSAMDAHFDEVKFGQQMAVMRGQIHNLEYALTKKMSPAALVQMPAVVLDVNRVEQSGMRRRWIAFRERAPWFSNW